MQFRMMTPADVAQVARIHASALAGDFLPSLGQNFLQVFFRTAIKMPGAVAVVVEDETVAGFVLGCLDSHLFFYDVLKRAAPQLAMAVIVPILKKPALLLKAIETFTYPKRESSNVEAELLIIAMDNSHRHQGGGRILVEQLDREFLARSVREYKLTVLQENSNANRFYQNLGFTQAGTFNLFNKPWLLYERSLTDSKK
jgi:ribosomal protein S18 acetylase RimI-like enzyme